jgi:hypothetical protein
MVAKTWATSAGFLMRSALAGGSAFDLADTGNTMGTSSLRLRSGQTLRAVCEGRESRKFTSRVRNSCAGSIASHPSKTAKGGAAAVVADDGAAGCCDVILRSAFFAGGAGPPFRDKKSKPPSCRTERDKGGAPSGVRIDSFPLGMWSGPLEGQNPRPVSPKSGETRTRHPRGKDMGAASE